MIGEGPAVFFSDACGLLSGQPPRRSTTHIVAHLMREVESAVRSVLQPPTEAGARPAGDKHRSSIIAVLDDLGISHDEPVAEFWLGVTGEGNPSGLAMRTHRAALDAPRPVDSAFIDFFANFEELLDRLLKRFEVRYISVFTRLDALLAEPHPAAAQVTRLRNEFPQNLATIGYFFARAGSGWLVPLAQGGYFSSPPEPILNEEEGTVELPFWPQAHFLIRVAPEAATESVDAALEIPTTDNSRVNGDLIELSLRVPADQSARLLPRIIASFSSRFGVLAAERIGRLCRHLADGGHGDAAMHLAEMVLARVPDGPGSRGSADSWSYAETLRDDIPSVTRAAGLPVLGILARILDGAITARTPDRLRELHQDLSTSWRPTLDGYPPSTDTDPATALVTAVREAATQLLDAGDTALGDVIAQLEAYDWPIFRRLVFFLLDSYGDDASDLVAAHLTDQAAIRDFNLDREYLALARHYAGSLSPRDQQRLLALIGRGPEVDGWARQYEQATGEPPPPAMARERVSRWQRDRLAAVEVILTPEWRAQYRSLVAEFGEAADPVSRMPMAVRDIALTSPVTVGELAASPIADLVSLLATWEPTGDPLGASRFSLASALGDAIQQDAARRSAEALAFIGLPAVYIAAVISALWRGARDGATLDWAAVVDLCAWADEQAVVEITRAGSEAWEWRDVRLNTLRLLEAGFRQGDNEAPITVRDQVWTIVENAANDPDPVPEVEADLYASGRTPDDLALSHMRPQALLTAIAFALWVRRHDPVADLIPFKQALDSHLDPQHESSRAVRSVYGARFPQLAFLDRPWASEHAAAVFPEQETERGLWEAAWGAYVTFAQVVADDWVILEDHYQIAVNLTDPTATDRRPLGRAYGLGRHLLIRYWSGQLTLASHDQLLSRFYQNAPASVCTDLMRFLGISLLETDALTTSIADRFTALWEMRLQTVHNGPYSSELAEFGNWFGAGKLGDEWELRQLLTVLSRAGRIDSVNLVLPRLAGMASAHASTSLAILEAWIRTGPDRFRLQLQEANIRTILMAGVASGDEAMAEAVTTIISLCIAEGLDLRDTLRGDH